jgi:outer membrane protein
MKKLIVCPILFLSLFVAFFYFPMPAIASPSTADIRIAYVDMQKALTDSKRGQSAQQEYEKEVRGAQIELDKKKAEFERLQNDFAKRRDSLSPEARVERGEELLSLEKDLKRSFEDSQGALRRKNAALVGKLVDEIREVVDVVGKEQGFTLILEKGGQSVLYADTSIDITNDVISAFDKTK